MTKRGSIEQRLDDQLRRAFAPPPVGEFADMARDVGAEPASPRQWWPLLAAAAALFTVVLVMLATGDRRGPEGHDGRTLGAMWAAAYDDAASRGFTGGCCESGFDLPAACGDRFECGVDVKRNGTLSVLGSYFGLETGGCLAVLARDGDTPLCVLIVPRNRDPRVELPADSTLRLTRRVLGNVVLYALSSEVVDGALAQFVVL